MYSFVLKCAQFEPLIEFARLIERMDKSLFAARKVAIKLQNTAMYLTVFSDLNDDDNPSKQLSFSVQTDCDFGQDATHAFVLGLKQLIDILSRPEHLLKFAISDFELVELSHQEYKAELFILNLATNQGADLQLAEIPSSRYEFMLNGQLDFKIASIFIDKSMFSVLKSFKGFVASHGINRAEFERINICALEDGKLQLTSSNAVIMKRQTVPCKFDICQTQNQADGYTYDYTKGLNMNLEIFLALAKMFGGSFHLIFNLHYTILSDGKIEIRFSNGHLFESQIAAPDFDGILNKFPTSKCDFKLTNEQFKEIACINIVNPTQNQMLYFELNEQDGQFVVKGLDEHFKPAVTIEYNLGVSYNFNAGILLRELMQAYKAVKSANENICITITDLKMMQLKTSHATVVTALRMMGKR